MITPFKRFVQQSLALYRALRIEWQADVSNKMRKNVVEGEADCPPAYEQTILSAKRHIVSEALRLGLGSQLPTNVEFLENHGLVAGTVQRALQVLKNAEALITRSKGHQGREIVHLDTGLCWNIAKLKPVLLIMPCGGSIEIDILIRQLTNRLSDLGIPYFITNQPGGENRIHSVLAGEFDIALTSFGAARNVGLSEGQAGFRVFAPETYYSSDRLVVVSRSDSRRSDWKTVAIDPNSSDHAEITKAEFASDQNIQLVDTDFRQVPSKVSRGEIDAGVWHVTSSPVPLGMAGLSATRLENPNAMEIHQGLSAACFTTNPNRRELVSLLKELDGGAIGAALEEALRNEDVYLTAFETIGRSREQTRNHLQVEKPAPMSNDAC